MSSSTAALEDALADISIDRRVEGVEAPLVVAPDSIGDIVRVIRVASAYGATIIPVGSGSTLRDERADIGLSTERLSGIIDYQPDDLTVVVGAGTTLGQLEDVLAERHHSAVLVEHRPDRTVGGVVASGASGYRRLRYGPTRDRVLEVTMATGYAEVIRAGGRLVKNVTGYDIPRLVTGSLGSLGIIGSVCLKLWPEPLHRVTVSVDDATAALLSTYKPVAVLETQSGSSVYLEGDEATVSQQVEALGGEAVSGFDWPVGGRPGVTASVLVPARFVAEAIRVLPPVDQFVAQHGVGVIDVGLDDVAPLFEMRAWAEAHGGSLVIDAYGIASDERLGTAPTTVAIQRRMKQLFDPDGVCHPGALPGGI